MEALGFSKKVRRDFHGVPYVISVSGDNESLHIEVEHEEDGRRWRSKFAARFIEEITQRTGNAKKFDVFVQMLLSALAQESGAVYLDVLTARDLEMLRRHANPQGPPTTSAVSNHSDKRYLIMTYRAEFDKVHYPLPLPLDERSEEETLRAMVSRLRSELSEAQKALASQAQQAAAPPASQQQCAAALDEEQASVLGRQNAELRDELRAARREVDQLRAELRLKQAPGAHGAHAVELIEAGKLKGQVSRLQAEIKSLKEDARQSDNKHKRELDQAHKELRQERQKVDRMQVQMRKLEDDRRQLAIDRPRSRPTSRSPSVDRARPPSRTSSRPVSRAGSVASSRDRTPSPSGHMGRSGSGGGRGPENRSWASQRSNSPGARRESPAARRESPGARRGVDNMGGRVPSPQATLSPYRRSTAPSAKREPSPGQRSRERTPSPSTLRRGPQSQAAPSQPSRPPAGSLREQRALSASGPGSGARPSAGGRYPSGTAARQGSAPRTSAGGAARGGGGLRGASPSEREHAPGSLFGLAANLGLGPGSLSSGSLPGARAVGGQADSVGPPDGVDACDIDARLQALQSFLKQTKSVAG